MIYNLVFRCFSICSDWTNVLNKLSFLKDVFLKKRYLTSFIDKCYKTFPKKPDILAVEKKIVIGT